MAEYAGEVCRGDPEQWFFFIPIQEREARGGRPSRLTSSGYWKATGSPNVIYSSSNRAIGIKRSMVFYTGRAPSGRKTKWKMNEYKAFQFEDSSNPSSTPKVCAYMCMVMIYRLRIHKYIYIYIIRLTKYTILFMYIGISNV